MTEEPRIRFFCIKDLYYSTEIGGNYSHCIDSYYSFVMQFT